LQILSFILDSSLTKLLKSDICVILKLCFIFLLTYGAKGQTAKCDYNYKYHATYAYKPTNTSYYACGLSTIQDNYDERLTRIDGQHEAGRNDADVKFIINYKNNKLKTFSSIFCQMFPNLEAININDAEMESIDDDSLIDCENLHKMWLNKNKIRELPENLLVKNPNLTFLLIHENQLTTLPENFFQNQRELEQLTLHENQISSLPSNIFHPLVKLEMLYLSDNKFQSINPEWFENLQNLKWLALDGNHLSEIPSKSFTSLISLEILWLYETKLKTLNFDSFDGLQNLQTLELQGNEISDLPVGVFTQLKNLQELELNSNKLTTIRSDSFGVHNQLTKVYLQDNKINAIDEKFIDNTAVSSLNMTNNICSQLDTETRSEIKPNLKKCFDNYQPCFCPTQTSKPSRYSTLKNYNCGKPSTIQNTETRMIGGSQISRRSFPW